MKIKVKIGFIVFVGLAWSYLLQPTLWPFPAHPQLKILALAASILLLKHLYRTLEFDVEFSWSDVGVLAAYAGFFAALNGRILAESITNDELYHAERAVFYLHGLKFLPSWFWCRDVLRAMPITELNSYLSFWFIFLSIGAWFSWTRFRRRFPSATARNVIYFAACVDLGLAMAILKIPAESHPPLRLLPLFVSQALFGLQDFSFRIPGVLAVSALSFMTYRLISRGQAGKGWFFPFVVGFSIYMIPIVFHTSAYVQPSIWAFVAAVACFYSAYLAVSREDERFLALAAVILGLGSLMRQNTIIVWPAFLAVCYLNRRFVKRWSLILAPLLFIVPYGMTLSEIGHPVVNVKMAAEASILPGAAGAAARTSLSPGRDLWLSMKYGLGLLSIWNTTTAPWYLLSLLGIAVVLWLCRSSLVAFYLILPAGYGLIFSITPMLWGVGRYQAEFVAPAIVVTLFLLALVAQERGRHLLLGGLISLGLFSYFYVLTIPHDVYFDHWSCKRLSTDSHLPYAEAIGFLHRQQSEGRFIIIGGTGTYGRLVVWLRGFNYADTERYWSAQQKFRAMEAKPITAPEFAAFLRENNVDYVLLQYGDRRERQLRSETLETFMEGFNDVAAESKGTATFPYVLQQTFIGKTEGAIDIFGKLNRRY